MKNLKSVIVYSVLLGLGVLFIGFMGGAYLPGISGYDLMSVCFEGFTEAYQFAMIAITSLFEIICVCLVVVLALLNLLVALGVIKNDKFVNRFNKSLVTLTVVAVIMVALSFVGFADFLKEGCGYAFIINIIVLVAAAAVAIYNRVTTRKEAKQEVKQEEKQENN